MGRIVEELVAKALAKPKSKGFHKKIERSREDEVDINVRALQPGVAVGCWLLVVGCWLLVVGCWLLVAGCWLLVVGCWLLIVGCWLLVIAGLMW